jgi:hypothetical protein
LAIDDDRVFLLYGTIREEESRKPLPNLLVRAFDRDLVLDDSLGETTTDGNGSFRLQFTRRAFRDVREEWPDVYLRVFDRHSGRQIYHTRDLVRWNVRVDQHYDITICRSELR